MRMSNGQLRFIDSDIINCYEKWKEFVTSVLKWQL